MKPSSKSILKMLLLSAALAVGGCSGSQPSIQATGGMSQPLRSGSRLASQRVASLAAARGATAASRGTGGESRVFVNWRSGQKNAVAAALAGHGARTHFVFDNLRSFVVTLPTAALAGLQNNPAVEAIEADPKRYMDSNQAEVPWGVERVQALGIWDTDDDGTVDSGAPTGSGVTVCIIDSGLFTGHADLQGVNVLGGYPSNWNRDYCGHGTHVAGTITGALNGSGVVGVSPGDVNLYLVKVFDDTCTWTTGSRLIDAINRCVDAGARVISMSLGGGGSSRNEEKAVNNAYKAGVVLVGSQGNDGLGNLVEDPPHYPSSYANVIGVAASDVNDNVAPWSVSNQETELAAPGVNIKSTVPYISTNTLTVGGTVYQANHIDFAKLGTATGNLADGGRCASSGSWSGQVVLCERGDISFYDKVVNAQNGGAVAVVIYNNAPGGFLGTLGDGNTSTVPAISLSQEDGQYLIANSLNASADVLSQLTEQASGYEYWDGTSMATPHVSGGVAVIMSAVPSASHVDIRNALRSTAWDLGPAGWDIDSGYGLVQVLAACQALGGCTNQPQCSVDTDCNDNNPCTTDTCNAGSCVRTNNTAACDDGNACTTGDACSGGSCVGGSPVSCGGADVCNPDSGQCEPPPPPPACATAGESCKQTACCDGLRCLVGGGRKGPTCGV